jgi:hypothetical protein
MPRVLIGLGLLLLLLAMPAEAARVVLLVDAHRLLQLDVES